MRKYRFVTSTEVTNFSIFSKIRIAELCAEKLRNTKLRNHVKHLYGRSITEVTWKVEGIQEKLDLKSTLMTLIQYFHLSGSSPVKCNTKYIAPKQQ